MQFFEDYNSPSEIKYYEVVNVHNVTSNESKPLAAWRETISVLVGEDEVKYHVDVHHEDNGRQATFVYYDNSYYYRNEIEFNNMRDHYVIKVVFVDSALYDPSQETSSDDTEKTFLMKHIMIAKRRYELL